MPESSSEFEALLEHLSATRGFDFTAYKRTTLMRRTRLRMQALSLESYSDYHDYLEVDPEEFSRFFNAVLINVTAFFRDPQAWELIQRDVIPAIIDSKAAHNQIRVWSAACASGEEAYTMAILFAEALGVDRAIGQVKIYATDVDQRALSSARTATYTAKELDAVPEELRGKYFETTGDGRYSFRRDLRRLVIFGRHDLLHDAPISRIDLLSCRNALMYFNSESQARILARFNFALRDGGFLFLGKAETILARTTDVKAVDLKLRVFVKEPTPELRTRLLITAQDGRQPHAGVAPETQQRIRETAFDINPVAQVVVDTEGKVALANETARQLFNIKERDIGQALQDLEVSYRPVELRSLLESAVSDQRPITVRETSWPLIDGTQRWLSTQAIPLLDEGGLVGVKFIFTDISSYKLLESDLESSHSEIATAYEELQSTNEELETTNEELHSTVEELETTNEELQSTNEELETMNEELHSSNEELESLNDVMRERSNELDRSNTYLNAILSSLGVGTVVLNRNLEVQLWNSMAEEQWGLRAEEVRGKHFLSLDIGLPVDRLIQLIRACLAGQDPAPLTVQATNRRGRTVSVQVTGRPLHPESAQGGAILLLDDTEQGATRERD